MHVSRNREKDRGSSRTSRKIQRRKPMIRLISPPYPPYRTEHTVLEGRRVEGLEFLDTALKLRNKFHMRIIIALVAHKGRILRKKP